MQKPRTRRLIQRRVKLLFESSLPSPPWMAYTVAPNTMRILVTILWAVGGLSFVGPASDATDAPDVIAKLVQGLSTSGIDELTSKIYKDGAREFSYHLETIGHLGAVQRDGHRYTIAAAKFIRSSAKGREYPPARGHRFLIVFNETFGVVTHGRMDSGDFHMDGHILKAGETIVADFGTTDPAIRYQGWLLDSSFMPYPFADRISEADWQSKAFLRRP